MYNQSYGLPKQTQWFGFTMHHCCKSQTVGWEETSTAGGNFLVSAGENNSSTVHNNLKCKELLWIDDAIRHQWCGDTLAAKSLRGSLQSSVTQMMVSVVYQSKKHMYQQIQKRSRIKFITWKHQQLDPSTRMHNKALRETQRQRMVTSLCCTCCCFLIVEIWSDPRWKLPGCERFRV